MSGCLPKKSFFRLFEKVAFIIRSMPIWSILFSLRISASRLGQKTLSMPFRPSEVISFLTTLTMYYLSQAHAGWSSPCHSSLSLFKEEFGSPRLSRHACRCSTFICSNQDKKPAARCRPAQQESGTLSQSWYWGLEQGSFYGGIPSTIRCCERVFSFNKRYKYILYRRCTKWKEGSFYQKPLD